MKLRTWSWLVLLPVWFGPAGLAQVTRPDLNRLLDSTVHEWRWRLGEVMGAHRREFDDSAWERVDVGFKWWPHDSTGWFRARVTVPETINGIAVRGGPLRMKAAVDNAAQAYVNGVFQQDFQWAGGDFVLTDNAQPGEVITVALHAINRPGSGSLLEARVVHGRAEPLVEGLRDFAKNINASLEDAGELPPTEAAHTRALADAALGALDLASYRACDREAFLESVSKARQVLLSDRGSVEERLRRTAESLQALKGKIQQGRAAGRDMAYPAVDARVVESFLQFTREDLAESHTGHQLRGLKAAAYIERLCRNALEAAGAEDMPTPRYQTGPTTIQAGAFWQQDRPVYFTGVGHFGQVRQDIPILGDYGLNLIQIEMGPANGLPARDQVDLAGIRENVVRWLDLAARHHVAVNLLISPHYFPQWAFDEDPAHRQCGRGFLQFCIEAPNTRAVMEKWLDALMPLIAHHPALQSICLSNEPQYQGHCSYERARFQAWLRAKWGTIQRANQAYGTSFRRFEDIELPQHAPPYGLYFDRWRFNQERFLAFHEMLRDRIHRYDPGLPVHAKVMSHAFEDPGRFEVGIDYERFTQLDRISGNDCGMSFTGDRPEAYACDWLGMAMNYTLQHSVARDQPIFNSENHLIGDGDARYLPEGYIRTVYWLQALHGQGATATWVWERGQGGDFAENILTRANCVRALGRVGLDLQRLGREVHALSRAPAQMAILYSHSSLLPSKDHVDEARAAFEGAYFTDSISDFITERQIEAGALARYKLVVAPRAAHVPDTVVAALNDYLRKGGAVMTVGRCFTHDEYGRAPRRTLAPSSRGLLVAYPESLSARAYRDILDRLLERTEAPRPARLQDLEGEPVWGVRVRAVETNGRLLVDLLNLSQSPVSCRLVTRTAAGPALNLIDRGETERELRLAPLEPMLLEVRAR